MRDDSASKKGTDDLHYCESSVPFFALSAQKSRAIRGGGANGVFASPARDKAPYGNAGACQIRRWTGHTKAVQRRFARGAGARPPAAESPHMVAKRPDELRGGGGIQADCLLDAKEHPAGNYVRLFAEMYGKYISD